MILYKLYFAYLDQSFLHSYLLNMRLKQKCDIAEFFLNTIVVFFEKLVLRGDGVKISRFVSQSKTNTPEFDLARIWLKSFRELFREFTVILFKLTDQSYLCIRLKVAIIFNLTVGINWCIYLVTVNFKDLRFKT